MGHLHDVRDSDTRFRINEITKEITNTASIKSKLIQYDHDSERFTFELPRFVEGHDMSLCDKVEVHYINIGKEGKSEDVYIVDDVSPSPEDDSVVIFSWLISGNATKYAGSLHFLIRFVCLDGDNIEYAWHTAIYSDITIADGMNNGEAVITEYSDVLEAWKQDLIDAGGSGSGLPEVTAEDNGKFLCVVDGVWAAASLPKYLGEYEVVE